MAALTLKVPFLCNSSDSHPCNSFETAEEAQQVVQKEAEGRSDIVAQGLPWSQNRGTVVATVIIQGTLMVDQRRYKRGRNIAQS